DRARVLRAAVGGSGMVVSIASASLNNSTVGGDATRFSFGGVIGAGRGVTTARGEGTGGRERASGVTSGLGCVPYRTHAIAPTAINASNPTTIQNVSLRRTRGTTRTLALGAPDSLSARRRSRSRSILLIT